jgi:acetyl esterase/lipase
MRCILKANNANYQLNLNRVILTGFSAGAHIASYVGISANNPNYENKLDSSNFWHNKFFRTS